MAASPDSALAWYQRGLQLFAIGNFDEARHAALESLRIDPADHDAEMLLLRVMSTQKGFFSLYWRWIQWLFSFTPNVRGMILIGLFVFMRVIRGLGERNPSLMPLILPVIIIWIFFCLYTWTAAPMFRFAVRKGWIK
jgi:tetratricopeptide (TPR) repeat protein